MLECVLIAGSLWLVSPNGGMAVEQVSMWESPNACFGPCSDRSVLIDKQGERLLVYLSAKEIQTVLESCPKANHEPKD